MVKLRGVVDWRAPQVSGIKKPMTGGRLKTASHRQTLNAFARASQPVIPAALIKTQTQTTIGSHDHHDFKDHTHDQ